MTEPESRPKVGERIATIEEKVRSIEKTVDKIDMRMDRAQWLIIATVILAVVGSVIASVV